LAKILDDTGINQVSLEDAEARNDLEALLPNFKNMTVILGVITVARSKAEVMDELKLRVEEALKYIDAERLILAPDCGLGYLSDDIINAKLQAMISVAKSF
jgi:5-methyltetrahydropteroyltriglutamate--homocysteine methyltransferase